MTILIVFAVGFAVGGVLGAVVASLAYRDQALVDARIILELARVCAEEHEARELAESVAFGDDL